MNIYIYINIIMLKQSAALQAGSRNNSCDSLNELKGLKSSKFALYKLFHTC